MSLTTALAGLARRGGQAEQVGLLGSDLAALRVQGGVRLPAGCVELIFSATGQARRAPASRAGRGEVAFAYHPGPYETAFAPFAAAPEIGLRLRYVADAADPRVAQQRFDLFLFSEVGHALTVASLHGAVAAAIQEALAQGMLDLPACTTLDEWHVFRAGLNELVYTRFGMTVEDCVPVDLGTTCDYAAQLRARQGKTELAADAPVRAAAAPAAAKVATDAGSAAAGVSGASGAAGADVPRLPPTGADPACGTQPRAGASAPLPEPAASCVHSCAVSSAAAPEPAASGAHSCALSSAAAPDPATSDAHALRRLFLELPAWSSAVRALDVPPELSAARRGLLQRWALAALEVNTMPSLAWAAPDRPLPLPQQAPRAAHSLAAVQALDHAWALLALWRMAAGSAPAGPGVHVPLLDEAERLAANLACHLAGRRAIHGTPADDGEGQRKEPCL